MESQPQNPEFRINPEFKFHPCNSPEETLSSSCFAGFFLGRDHTT